MGSWSEGCAISGMEIAEQDECYVALLTPHKYNYQEWSIVIPPVKGRYDDYGTIRVLDEEPYKTLFDIPDVWTPLEGLESLGDKEVLPFWIHATAFDCLSILKREDGGTVGRDFLKHIQKAEKTVREVFKKRDERLALLPLSANSSNQLALSSNQLALYEIEAAFGTMHSAWEYMGERVYSEQPFDILKEAYRRCFVLDCGARELRKRLSPQNGSHGPQWGGERALFQFYKVILDATEKKLPKRKLSK